MIGRTLVPSVYLAVALAGVSGCDPGDVSSTASTTQEILGGDPVSVGQFPTAVGVVVGSGGLCTGTLVASDIVMTAAHCISPQVLGYASQAAVTSETRVVLDAASLYSGQGTVISATETIPHPAFTRPGQPDVGIIRLSQSVTDRDPTPINLDATAAPVGVEVTMVGYGVTEQGGAGVGYYLEHRTSTSCAGYGVSDQMFLCFSQTSGVGKCSGDSGGPSYAQIDGVQALVSITSFGDQNCEYFGAEYRVDHAREFLEEHTPELFCVADNLCDSTCGEDGRQVDPDCAPKCATNSDCDDNSVCNLGEGVCEPAPFAPGGIGSECGSGMPECASGLCATSSEGSFCTSNCGSDDDCPDGFECQATSDGSGACWVSEGGCRAGSGSAPFGALLFALGALLALGRRRRS